MAFSLRVRRAVLGATLLAHLVQPLHGMAQVVADPAAGHRPIIDAAPNGVPLVHIVAPSAAGVSRNLYQQFNVDPRGLVLNNSTSAVATQLAGFVPGNAQLGQPARIVLNEVTGNAASMLRGYAEIAGSRAELVIANPNGITCAGCGFINASRGVLTTGVPVFGALGTLDAFDVRRGVVAFEGAGLNARNVDRLDVLARAVVANAEVWANALNVITGANRIDYASLGTTPIAGEGAKPAFALDVAAIGGMYADRIRLVGTEAGLGVNMRGAIDAMSGSLALTTDGRLVQAGRMNAAEAIEVRAGSIVHGGTTYAPRDVSLASTAALENTGVIAAGTTLSLDAATLDSTGTLAAGVAADGALGTAGTLRANVTGAASLAGSQLASGADLVLRAADLDVSAARIFAGRDLSLTATAQGIDARGATVDAGRTLGLDAAGALRNDGGLLRGAALSIDAGSLDNRRGRIDQTAAGSARATIRGTLDNTDGVMRSDGALTLRAVTLDNTRGAVEAVGTLAIESAAIGNDGGALYGVGALDVRTSGAIVSTGTLASRGTARIEAGGALDNARGVLIGEALDVRAASIGNAAGVIEQLGATAGRIVAAGTLDNRGGRIAGIGSGALEVSAGTLIDNTAGGLVGANGALTIHAPRVTNAGGAIEAGDALAIAAPRLDNADGRIRARGTADVDAGTALDNVRGLLAADGALTLAAGAIDNRGGRIASGAALAATAAAELDNRAGGQVGAAGSARIAAAAIENDTGRLGANANLDLRATRMAGAGVAAAGANLTLDLQTDYANPAGGELSAGGTLAITTPGALVNAGRIDGGVVRTQSASLYNTAALIGGEVQVTAANLGNAGAAAVIGAVGDLRLHVANTLANTDGALLYSGANLAVAADAGGARTALVWNEGSTIEAGGNVTLRAQTLENRRQAVSIATDETVRTRTHYQVWDDSWSPAVNGNPAYSPLIIYPDDRQFMERHRFVDTVVTEDRVAYATPPAQLLAGGAMWIDAGAVNNLASRIAAGGASWVGGAVQNQGYGLNRVQRTTTTHMVCTDISGAGPGNLGSCSGIGWQPFGVASLLTTPIGALPASIESGAALTIAGPSLRNIVLNANGTPATGLVTTLPPGAPPVSGAGLPVSAGAPAAPPAITLPTSALYALRLAPDQPFLVETDARFTQFGRFISSDYMLARLGLLPGPAAPGVPGLAGAPGPTGPAIAPTGPGFVPVAAVAVYAAAVLDADITLKRLGDAFYETRLVRDEIFRLTGRRFLDGYTNDYDVYLALMDEGLVAARRLSLRVGIALSAAEVAALTNDIVWLVQQEVVAPDGSRHKVLVPVVYLARVANRDLSPSGALIAAADIDLRTHGELVNSGTIAGASALVVNAEGVNNVGGTLTSRGLTAIAARGDVLNRSGAIVGDDVRITAGRDVVNETLTGALVGQNTARTVFGTQGRIQATDSLAVSAGRDVVARGAAATAGGDAVVSTGRDVTLGTVTLSDRRGSVTAGEHLATTSETHSGAALAAGRDLSIAAGRDATLTAAQVRAERGLELTAGGNVTIGAAEDRSTFSFSGSGRNWSAQGTSDARRVVGSSLSAGQDLVVFAGAQPAVPAAVAAAAAPAAPSSSDLLILGSAVRSDAGDVTLVATRDVIIASVAERSAAQSQESRRSGSVLARKSVDEATTLASSVQVGSLVSGETVSVVARRDLAVRGSQVAGTGDVALQAGRDVEIVSTESTIASGQSRTERRSGFIGSVGGGGIGFTLGSQKQTLDVLETSVVNTPSVVGSAAGSVAIEAAETYRQRGSEVIAGRSIDIRAADVTIEAAQDRYARDEQQTFKRSGLAVSLGGPVVTNAVLARDAAMRIGDVEDDRLKAVYAVRVARLGYGAAQQAQQVAKDPSSGFAVNVGFATASSEQRQTTTQTISVPSSIVADGDVRIHATGGPAGSGGDLTVAGSVIQGADVSLLAARDLMLRATQDTGTLQSSLSSSNAGAGVTIGLTRQGGTSLAGFYVQGGRGSGSENGNSVTNVETLVSARGDLTLQSGRDTTLAGAIASGETVTATVGRNLSLQSLQDVETYSSRNRQAGGTVTIGAGGIPTGVGGQAVNSRTDSDYASVREQTAIRAGAGGLDILVGANTNLAGAVIDSSAAPDRNRLSTGTLTFSNIENRADYSSGTVGGQAGVGVGPGGAARPGVPAPILGTGGSGKEESTTYAAVAPGTLEIRDPQRQTQDVATLSRNPTSAHEALERIFDKKTVAERQELATVFGQEAFIVVGDIAKTKTLPYEKAEISKQHAERYLELKDEIAAGRASEEEIRLVGTLDAQGATTDGVKRALAEAVETMAKHQADYDAWKEGGTLKVALHAVVGAMQTSLGGSGLAAGAAATGVVESIRGATADLPPELQQWVAVVVGAAAGALTGGTSTAALAGGSASLTAEQFNRQLHPSEEKWLRNRARDFAKQEGISERRAMERLTQQALREVDLFWRSVLADGDDPAAKGFLGRADATFKNDLGEQQRLFTVSGQQLLRPELFADSADPFFYRKFAQSGIARSLNEGLRKELRDLGVELKDSAVQLARVARENPGVVLDAVWKAVKGLPGAVVDSFSETGRAIGEGSAVALNKDLSAKLNAIYGADVSTAQQTLLAIRIASSITGAAGVAKAGTQVGDATIQHLGRKLDEILDQAAQEALVRSGGVRDRHGQPLLDISKLSSDQKSKMGDLFGQETVRRIVPNGEKLARVPGVGEQGIDDLYRVNRPDVDYVVIEYKFVGNWKETGSSRLGSTKDGLQGSDTWVLGGNRLQRSVGLDRAIDVQNAVRLGRTETWVVTVRADGSTAVQVLDGLGKPKNIDASTILRPNVDLSGAKP